MAYNFPVGILAPLGLIVNFSQRNTWPNEP
jgi:hypothetical protein